MNWKTKLLAGLRWVKDTVVYYANIVIDPPPAAIKWYVAAVLVAAIGGGLVLGPLFNGAPASKPFALISPNDVIVTVPPPKVSGPPASASASPKDLPPLELLKAPTKKKAAGKRKAKVTAARDDMRF
jgi:hypothetical protein